MFFKKYSIMQVLIRTIPDFLTGAPLSAVKQCLNIKGFRACALNIGMYSALNAGKIRGHFAENKKETALGF